MGGQEVSVPAPATAVEGFRLSPQQRHVWSSHRGEPAAGCAQAASSILGQLDRAALAAAVAKLVERHEVLRTTFRRLTDTQTWLQVIAETSTPSWTEVDLSGCGPEEQRKGIDRFLEEDRRRGFDYHDGPLLGLSVLALAPERHLLVVRLPVLVADARGLDNLVAEIAHLLTEPAGVEPAEEEAVQYLQFSEWQNELLEDEEEQEGRDYWRRQDTTAVPRLKLPFEPAVPPAGVRPWEPATLSLSVEPGLAAGMEELARRHDAGLSAFLLACWQIVLARLSGVADFVVRCVLDGRTFEVMHGALGLYAKSIPLRWSVDSRFRFGDFLRRVDRRLQEAREWQDYFAWPEGDGAPDEDSCQFEFVHRPPEPGGPGSNRLRFSPHTERVYVDRFKVKLFCRGGPDDLSLELQYDPGVYRSGDVRCLARQLETLIPSALRAPEAALRDLETLSGDERRQLLVELNDTAVDFAAETLLHRAFEEQARRRPGETAVVFGWEELSFAELNARANQLARFLCELGVAPEVTVALFFDNPPDVIVGLLAVLKAGGAYLPLDMTLPRERLGAMLRVTGTSVVLTRSRWLPELPPGARQPVCLDSDRERFGRLPETDLPDAAVCENLAYVLFTSGSTGTPKAVGVEHRQLANYLHAAALRLKLPPAASYGLVSTLSADLGLTAIFSALCLDGCLHIFSDEHVVHPDAFAEEVRRQEIACLKIVPSHLAALLSGSQPAGVLPDQLLVLGGEALSWELVEAIRALAPGCRILNEYGPTETTVGVTAYEVCDESGGGARRATLPMGLPLANSRIYLVDPELRPVACGVTGEVLIGGAGLARGYLAGPAATAEKFLPDRFGEEPGTRLYRSGDLARFLPDSPPEFVGRADHQVKIRGFRVELGEIEAALLRHPAVGEAVVCLSEDPAGRQRLVAYGVGALGQPRPETGALRAFLSESLPLHMLPATFVWLPDLPLTRNGKVDRRALPSPEEAQSAPRSRLVSPRNSTELELMVIWQELLGIRHLGVTDPFFDLGGDSLSALRVMARINQHFHVELEPTVLFEQGTIERMASLLSLHTDPMRRAPLVKLHDGSSERSFFGVPPGSAEVMCFLDLARCLDDELSLYGLQVGETEEGRPIATLEEMAAHHVDTIRGVQPEGPYRLLGWSLGGLVAFEMARQLRDHGEEVDFLALLDSELPPKERRPAESDDGAILSRYASDLARFLGGDLSVDLRKLDYEQQLQQVVGLARGMNIIPPEIEASQLRRFFEVLKRNFQAVEAYEPGVYQGSATLLTAGERHLDEEQDPTLGWSEFVAGELEVRVVPGGHFSMLREPHVRFLAEKMKAVGG